MSMRERIANGDRLSVVLTPNHENLGKADPEYNECYALPFVFFEDEIFAGLTRPGHLLLVNGQFQLISFSYNNSLHFYSIIYANQIDTAQNQIGVKLLSRTHYRHHEFVTREPGRLIFACARNGDGTVERQDYGLRESIGTGANHYLVADLGSGVLQSLPVDIAYDFFATGTVEFRTESVITSSHVLNPGTFMQHLQSVQDDLDSVMNNPGFASEISAPLAVTYLRVRDDAAFWTVQDENTGTGRSLDWFKVFELP